MLIDSHHHLWQYSATEYPWIDDQMTELRRDFWSNELREIASTHHVDGFVSVQARQSLTETETLLQLAETEPLIHGVVGWVDFRSPELAAQLDRFRHHRKLRGMRHVVQDEPDDDFLLGKTFNDGVAQLAGSGLVYDVLIFAKHLKPTIQFVRNHASIPMVLDHIAKPAVAAGQFDQSWKASIEQLAEQDNIVCKFSGVATEVRDATWDVETIRPYWDTVLEAFTPSRLMFGSDWPVCLLRTDYGCWLATVRELAAELSSDEQQQIFSGTAIQTYRLEQS
ncbi:amidohydrolase family protein [Stieleria sp. JC731]|uniref:amidohydrolase family protein n=1 Tax=Pirellulaceae TaxID=2691357 RepID=UPI001E286393|nr:amidohydrolase family protein [Stieleria sp. JC731]MCC9603615.1 amidohydrolase family protein [Stieleria sp. JC731]